MKITIINGTNRVGNKTLAVSQAAKIQAEALGYEARLVDLGNFTELFTNQHVTFESANYKQQNDLLDIMTADVLLFVVPTYHSGIPSSLKNFLDLIKCKACFEDKVIGLIASNKGQDLGARQAQQVLNGILSYQSARSFVIPRITIIDFDHIDHERLKEFIKTCGEFSKTFVHDWNSESTEEFAQKCVGCI